ncbi:MAG: hypothetical protein H3Z54_13585 [archaeon]|nr:hypothetical protein [archaeon]
MSKNNLPKELIDFLSQGNNILLIKGNPGTGKTILSLELLKHFQEDRNAIYVSTRVTSERLFAQFPWLEGVIKPEHVLEAPKKGITISDTKMKKYPTQFEHVYDLAMRTENPMIVVDSWEAVTEDLDPGGQMDVIRLLETLISSKNANIILVSEAPDRTTLEYLVDGVVVLNMKTIDGRRTREIELMKLRGVEIDRPKYFFTLLDGKFRSFGETKPQITEVKRTEPLPDTETHFSTGIEDLDKILGGGYPKGGVVQLELDENTSVLDFHPFLTIAELNFIEKGRAVLILPIVGHDANIDLEYLRMFGSSESETQFVRVFERKMPGKDQDRPCIVILDPQQSLMENLMTIANVGNELKEKTGKPVLGIVGNDAIVSYWGEESYREVASVAVMISRAMGNLIIGICTPGLEKITQIASNLSDIHIKLIKKDGALMLYGIKPYTGLYGVTFDFSKGYPYPNLTPIV